MEYRAAGEEKEEGAGKESLCELHGHTVIWVNDWKTATKITKLGQGAEK